MTAEAPRATCRDLDAAIEEHKKQGFRLDMIFPADLPREALMSRGDELVGLMSEPPASAGGKASEVDPTLLSPETLKAHEFGPPACVGGSDSEWTIGRAGMQYRDLIPGRLGGKVIASHIRLPFGGEVPDSVHYHKIDFQMIYCVRGRIQVVYEDQGPPFWLETGDLVLQPPEIRHRVLYSEAGAEVIEVSSPAEHETWIDHEMKLPNDAFEPERHFYGQRFLHFKGGGGEPYIGSGYSQIETGAWEKSGHRLLIFIKSFVDRDNNSRTRGWSVGDSSFEFVYVLSGNLKIVESDGLPSSFRPSESFAEGSSFVLQNSTAFTFDWSPDLKLLHILIPTENGKDRHRFLDDAGQFIEN